MCMYVCVCVCEYKHKCAKLKSNTDTVESLVYGALAVSNHSLKYYDGTLKHITDISNILR